MGFFSNSDIAIDVGTANTCIFTRGEVRGSTSRPIVAYNTVRGYGRRRSGPRRCDMLGRTPGNITAVRPMKGGVIADFEAVEKMLEALRPQGEQGPRARQGAPPRDWRARREITPVERRAVRGERAAKMKASEVHLVDEPMAAAYRAGLPIVERDGEHDHRHRRRHDEIAVISMAGVGAINDRCASPATSDAAIPATCGASTTSRRRADRRADQDRLGSAWPLEEDARWTSRAATRPTACRARQLTDRGPRGALRAGAPDPRRCATCSSGSRRNCAATSSIAASC